MTVVEYLYAFMCLAQKTPKPSSRSFKKAWITFVQVSCISFQEAVITIHYHEINIYFTFLLALVLSSLA